MSVSKRQKVASLRGREVRQEWRGKRRREKRSERGRSTNNETTRWNTVEITITNLREENRSEKRIRGREASRTQRSKADRHEEGGEQSCGNQRHRATLRAKCTNQAHPKLPEEGARRNPTLRSARRIRHRLSSARG